MADIISPIPGVFYAKPGPDKDPFVVLGDHVEAGQAVGIVEVMKQFSEIRADVAGTVTAVNVPDGATVAPGDVLLVIDAD